MRPINVLSLFDGISCGQVALEKAGIPVANYFASEIDKYTMAVTQHHYPKTIQLGDITNWRGWDLPDIDLILAGSPCQGFSLQGKKLNFHDPRSALYFVFEDILHHHNPQWWLLENVKMKKEWSDTISDRLGVSHIKINSGLVSAHNRDRLYWSNLPITVPSDKNIVILDILDEVVMCAGCRENTGQIFNLPRKSHNGMMQVGSLWGNSVAGRIYSIHGKARSLAAMGGGGGSKNGLISFDDGVTYRQTTPLECERLQTLPDHYTMIQHPDYPARVMSNNARFKMLANGWTVDVVVPILVEIGRAGG